jgi:hypothetical protein
LAACLRGGVPAETIERERARNIVYNAWINCGDSSCTTREGSYWASVGERIGLRDFARHCPRYRSAEAAAGAALAEQNVAFIWGCYLEGDSAIFNRYVLGDDWYCPSAGYRGARGSVMEVRHVEDFHSYSYAVLLDPPTQGRPGWRTKMVMGSGEQDVIASWSERAETFRFQDGVAVRANPVVRGFDCTQGEQITYIG